MDMMFVCTTFVDVLKYSFYIVIALLVLLLMITIHEFGHFIVGKKLGFKINEFAIGFGKILWKHTTKDGILVSLRLIPLGGYCAFEGEDENSEVDGSFNLMAPWKRLLVLFSGAFFNFLSAVLLFFVLLLSVGYADRVQVNNIGNFFATTNLVELQQNDVIYKVGDIETNFVYDNYFSTLITTYAPGDMVPLTVKRNGQFVDIQIQNGRELNNNILSAVSKEYIISTENKIVVLFDEIQPYITFNGEDVEVKEKLFNDVKYFYFECEDNGYWLNMANENVYTANIGLAISTYKYSFLEALGRCVPFTCEWGYKILCILGSLITGQVGIENLGGPITTISSIASYTQTNWLNLLILFPLISVNLAVFNWLPFPALDGARMVFVLIEWIRRKPINRNIEGYIHTAGLFILFAFVIVVDVLHFVL